MSQIAYWGLVLLALLQFFVCLPMSGIWGQIFRFPIAVVGWSAYWFVIAGLHNLVADEKWLYSNYTWEQGKEILDGLLTFVGGLWQSASPSFFENITTALHQASMAIAWLKPDLGDLKLAFPQTCRHFSQRSFTLPLELMRTELIEMLVAPNTIVETLDVIEDF